MTLAVERDIKQKTNLNKAKSDVKNLEVLLFSENVGQ